MTPLRIAARILLASVLASLALIAPQRHADAAESPASVVAGFYRKDLALHLSGAPTPQQLQVIAPYLSQHLQALLERAWQQRQRDIARAPDDKPAFADGDLFSSLFEGPTQFEIVGTETLMHEYAVTVRFTYKSGGTPTVWKDVVRLASKQGRLVIVDIEYGGTWEFAAKGTLVSALDQGMMAHE
jgi:hypothetical protein